MNIQIIIGSTRPGRLGKPLAEWFLKQAKKSSQANFELIDLADFNLPLLDEPMPAGSRKYTKEHTKKWSEAIARADGYVLVTPEYNHGTSAALKNALDYLYFEWQYKPVTFLGYGGFGGTRAIEQLVVNCVELNMFPLQKRVHVTEPWSAIDDNGQVKPESVKGNIDSTIEALISVAEATKSLRK